VNDWLNVILLVVLITIVMVVLLPWLLWSHFLMALVEYFKAWRFLACVVREEWGARP
jgi:hypothetical protein